MKNLKFKKLSKGFTMIELVIALFVLTVAVIGVYSAFSVMVVTTAQMSDKFTASYLSQEGIEIVRNIRDNNWLQDSDWTAGLLCDSPPCEWEADYKTGTLSGAELTSYSNKLLYINNNFYDYNTAGTETKFKRKITINSINDHVLQVIVKVEWAEKKTIFDFSENNSITAEDYLYNWY